MNVFLVVVTLDPTQKAKHDDGAVPTIVVPATAVIAKDSQQAAMKAVALVPNEHAASADRLSVQILPFTPASR